MENTSIEENESFLELLGGRDPSSLGNNELVEALSLIPDISETLGNVDIIDGAKLLGLIEEVVRSHNKSIGTV